MLGASSQVQDYLSNACAKKKHGAKHRAKHNGTYYMLCLGSEEQTAALCGRAPVALFGCANANAAAVTATAFGVEQKSAYSTRVCGSCPALPHSTGPKGTL